MEVLSPSSRCREVAARLLAAWAITIVLALGCLGTTVAWAQIQASEYQVKAAFVFKFGNYVEWPPQTFATSSSPLVIGVVGADALGDELTRISIGRTVGGRPVVVRKLRYGESLTGLHAVFIGKSTDEQLAATLDAGKGQSILTITESEDGLRHGSVINFVVVSDKVRFDISLPSAEAGRLKISSQLLAVARKIEGAP
jgi:hypothetical protein